MKTSLLFLSCAATLAMASCSQEKTVDTTTDGGMTTTTTTTTTTTPAYTDEAYNSRADRIAADMAAKMKLDDATRTKVRTVYYNREKRFGDLQSKYATDTTGRAAAMRTVYMDTDKELKTVFTDPTQYSAYESSRQDYYEDRYLDNDAMSSSTSGMDSTGSMGSSSGMSSSDNMTSSDNSNMASGTDAGVTKMKAKAEDGSKIKMKDNGKTKVKDAEGNKSKTE
ncbi:hypothetical protein SAMN02745146_2426 [Hymenobacter daecheongensis DSM 21074]|uniref:Lipoprotein n=1 Tax=Hymenobacter daecheongensis DSM 21074 TaxID=1121955 RepID=A0A1M6GWV5_9BACT|nr:hypothetical protein [Hymenobacter daecheongensis]SHJ14419.1 hypothetical protein SAMN02745146_2426 [Hymenobacter daecheongensis DSM 21074]